MIFLSRVKHPSTVYVVWIPTDQHVVPKHKYKMCEQQNSNSKSGIKYVFCLHLILDCE